MLCFVNLIHPVPSADYEFSVKILGQKIIYRLQTFLYALQFLKVYHIFNLIEVFSVYTNTSEKYW
jgi:hypothetical protein